MFSVLSSHWLDLSYLRPAEPGRHRCGEFGTGRSFFIHSDVVVHCEHGICLILHTERYKRLNLVPKRNRKRVEKVAVVHSSVNSNSKASSSDTKIGQIKRTKRL